MSIGSEPFSVVNLPVADPKILYFAGMGMAGMTQELRQRLDISKAVSGVVVIEIKDDSAAKSRGILPGDVIQKIDQIDVTSPLSVIKMVNEAKEKGKTSVLLLVKRGTEGRFVAIPVNK